MTWFVACVRGLHRPLGVYALGLCVLGLALPPAFAQQEDGITVALMSFAETDTTKSQKTKSAIKASFSAWGASGEGQVIGGTNSVAGTTNAEIEITYTQIGGAGGIIPTSQKEFFEKLRALPDETLRGPQFHTMDVTPYSDLPGWPQAIALDTADDPVDVVLTNYYWTLNSINQMIDDMLSATTVPQEDRLETVQDAVTGLRKRIFAALVEAYQTVERETQTSYLWGLFTREDKAAVARQKALQAKLTALQDELVALSFGRPNPNLLKLFLPVPGAEDPTPADAEAAQNVGTANPGGTTVTFYLRRQAKRICAANPQSPECLTNGELDRLAACVPIAPDWLKPRAGGAC